MALRGRKYSVDGQRACAASAPETILAITSNANVRPYIYDMLMGASGTPADNALLWWAQRYTVAGTSTAVTPTPLDPADPASQTAAGKNHSVDPTYTANLILFHLALNQRASHRWIADPDGPLICPATAANGIGLYPVNASYTGNVDATIHFSE